MARLLTRTVAALLFVTACAQPGPPTLADGTVQAALPAAVWPSDPGLVTAVSCPGLVTTPIAQRVACTAEIDGEEVHLDVVIADAGVAGAVVREDLFVVADARADLAARLAADLGLDPPPTIVCDRTVLVARPGDGFACRATREDSDVLIDFTVTLLDDTGAWRVDVAAPG